jgi:hypothetical protein
LEEHADWLSAVISKQSDLTLDEVVAAMRKQRIAGSRSAVWRFFERHNISFIKTCGRRSKSERTWPAGEHQPRPVYDIVALNCRGPADGMSSASRTYRSASNSFTYSYAPKIV